MTNKRAGQDNDEDQGRWSEYEDAVERREALYQSGSAIFWDLTVLVELWLQELQKVGLSALDPASQAPPKQAEARGPERSSPWADTRPVRLEKGKVLWLRFDGPRTEQGYKNVRVSDEPLRTDAAIVAALAALEAAPVDRWELDVQIRQLRSMLQAYSDAPLHGPLTKRLIEVPNQLRDTKDPNRDWQPLQRNLHLRFFEFVLAILRDRWPGFCTLPLNEQLDALQRASYYVNEIVDSSLRLLRFLEHGTLDGVQTRTLETAAKRVEAAVLRDVAGLSPKEIAERFGIPKPPNFHIKKDFPAVRNLVNKGRSLLEEALGEGGWQRQVEAMKAEMQWWQELSEREREAEHWVEGMEHLIGPNAFGDVARRQARGDDDPNKGKRRIRYNPFDR